MTKTTALGVLGLVLVLGGCASAWRRFTGESCDDCNALAELQSLRDAALAAPGDERPALNYNSSLESALDTVTGQGWLTRGAARGDAGFDLQGFVRDAIRINEAVLANPRSAMRWETLADQGRLYAAIHRDDLAVSALSQALSAEVVDRNGFGPVYPPLRSLGAVLRKQGRGPQLLDICGSLWPDVQHIGEGDRDHAAAVGARLGFLDGCLTESGIADVDALTWTTVETRHDLVGWRTQRDAEDAANRASDACRASCPNDATCFGHRNAAACMDRQAACLAAC